MSSRKFFLEAELRRNIEGPRHAGQRVNCSLSSISPVSKKIVRVINSFWIKIKSKCDCKSFVKNSKIFKDIYGRYSQTKKKKTMTFKILQGASPAA